MEPESLVEGEVPVQEGLPHLGDQVATHGNQDTGIGEHHGGGSTSSDGHTIASDTTQAGKLTLDRVI